MPIYEYKCLECEHELEAYQGVKDAPLIECPDCGKHTLERLISSVFGFVRDIKTLGQLAEKNTKKAGSKLDTPEADKTKKRKEKQREINKINRMTNEQKVKYIREGK